MKGREKFDLMQHIEEAAHRIDLRQEQGLPQAHLDLAKAYRRCEDAMLRQCPKCTVYASRASMECVLSFISEPAKTFEDTASAIYSLISSQGLDAVAELVSKYSRYCSPPGEMCKGGLDRQARLYVVELLKTESPETLLSAGILMTKYVC